MCNLDPKASESCQNFYLSKVGFLRVLLQQREGNWSRNTSRNCFWDRHWKRAGQPLANIFPCLYQQSQKSLRRLTWLIQYLIDCASIILGIIGHYEHNFHLFFLKKHCQRNLHFWLVLQHKIFEFIDHETNVIGPRSVSQANLSNKINCLFGPDCSNVGQSYPSDKSLTSG